MADVLQTDGKYYGMLGIRNEITTLRLMTAAAASISTVTVTGSTAFSVNVTTGVMTNDNAIEFTIGAEDVGNTAAIVAFETATNELMRIDLDSTVSLTSAGTATIAAGDLSVSL